MHGLDTLQAEGKGSIQRVKAVLYETKLNDVRYWNWLFNKKVVMTVCDKRWW